MDVDGATTSGDDPFRSLLPLCHVSSSQEERLQRCPFAPQLYDADNDVSSSESDGVPPVESVGIFMVSPPESEEGENNSNSHDVFLTPPEEAAPASSSEPQPPRNVDGRADDNHRNREARDGGGESLAVGVGCWEASDTGTVDLSRDTDLGFSEVELGQRVGADFDVNRSRSEVSVTESMGYGVLSREFSLEDGLGESPLKKLKISEHNSENSADELESEGDSPPSNTSDGRENHGIGAGNEAKSGEESSAKRKLEFTENDDTTEVVQLEIGTNDSVLELRDASEGGVVNGERQSNCQERISAKEFLEAMEVLQHDSSGNTEEKVVVECQQSPPPATAERRRLPNSILGQSENAAVGKVQRELTLVDVLKLLKEDREERNPNCSFLEICKRRGMTFPRPAWWPEQGADNGDW